MAHGARVAGVVQVAAWGSEDREAIEPELAEVEAIPLRRGRQLDTGKDPGVSTAEDELALNERAAGVDAAPLRAGIEDLYVSEHLANLRTGLPQAPTRRLPDCLTAGSAPLPPPTRIWDRRRACFPAVKIGVEVSEAQLADVFALAQPHDLLHQIPDELRDWVLPVNWNRERLWALQDPVLAVEIGSLRWHYDLPWWRDEDRRWFQVRPADFIEDPGRFPEHARRVDAADLRLPLHGMRRRGRVQVLDGIHRLVLADRLGRNTVDVMLLTSDDLAEIVDHKPPH